LWILGTIILGALGSGLWDVALKAWFVTIGRAILTGITFGYSSLRDGYYIEVAKGHTDRASLWLVFFSTLPFFGALGFYVGGLTGRKHARQKISEEASSLAVLQQRIGRLDRELKWLERATVLFGVFFLSVLVFRSFTLGYISSAVTHFEQSYTICLPFLTEPERANIRSRFALIRSRSEYVGVLERLKSVATKNGVSLPKFTAW